LLPYDWKALYQAWRSFSCNNLQLIKRFPYLVFGLTAICRPDKIFTKSIFLYQYVIHHRLTFVGLKWPIFEFPNFRKKHLISREWLPKASLLHGATSRHTK
jgi:hypothetical protein